MAGAEFGFARLLALKSTTSMPTFISGADDDETSTRPLTNIGGRKKHINLS